MVLEVLHPKGVAPHLIVCMITSQVDATLKVPCDVLLEDFSQAGLPKPSLVRLAKVVTLEAGMVKKKLGSIQGADRKAVVQEFKRLFKTVLS